MTIAKPEHQVTEWKITREAATAAPGSKDGICELGKETIAEEIPSSRQ